MAKLEIRNSKGKVVESVLGNEIEGIERVKAIRASDEKNHYELVEVRTVYDTANPPVNTGFF